MPARRARARARGDARAARRARRGQLAAAGADVFVAALVADLDWSAPVALDDDGWKRAGAHLRELADLVAARGPRRSSLHPHVGTLVETAADVERALAAHRRAAGASTPATC